MLKYLKLVTNKPLSGDSLTKIFEDARVTFSAWRDIDHLYREWQSGQHGDMVGSSEGGDVGEAIKYYVTTAIQVALMASMRAHQAMAKDFDGDTVEKRGVGVSGRQRAAYENFMRILALTREAEAIENLAPMMEHVENKRGEGLMMAVIETFGRVGKGAERIKAAVNK